MFSRCLTVKPSSTENLLRKLVNVEKLANSHPSEELKNETYQLTTIDQHKVPIDIKKRIIIPPNMTNEVIKKCHEHLGHPGKNKLYKTLQKSLNIQNLSKRVQGITENCKKCQMEKNHISNEGKLIGCIKAETLFEKIAVDLYGPISLRYFKEGEEHDKVMLVVLVDVYSRITEIVPTKSIILKDHGKNP